LCSLSCPNAISTSDGALDDFLPGGDDRRRLLALQHRSGDLRRVGQVGDPGFFHPQAGDIHLFLQFLGKIIGDLLATSSKGFLPSSSGAS
jgi:hypothetical protein